MIGNVLKTWPIDDANFFFKSLILEEIAIYNYLNLKDIFYIVAQVFMAKGQDFMNPQSRIKLFT